jgi:hypothetical protein
MKVATKTLKIFRNCNGHLEVEGKKEQIKTWGSKIENLTNSTFQYTHSLIYLVESEA